jgi:hypothetical protein
MLMFGGSFAEDVASVQVYKEGYPFVENEDIRLAIDLLMEEVVSGSNLSLKTRFNDDMEEVILSFQKHRSDAISMNVLYFLQEYDRINPYIGDLWSLVESKNQLLRKFYIVVNKKSEISSIEQLKGKVMGLLEFDSMQELYLDGMTLQKYQKQSKQFFSRKQYYPKSSRALLKLFFNKIDACIVSERSWNTAVEINPQLKRNLQIIDISPEIFPTITLILTHKKSSELAKLYEKFAVASRMNAKTKQVLMMYQAAESQKLNVADLKPLRDFYNQYRNAIQKLEKR